MHRRRGGSRRPLIAVVLAAIAAPLAPLEGTHAATVWLSGRGGAAVPGEGFHPDDCACVAPEVVMATSCAQPYGLEHCYRASLIVGYRGRALGLLLDWDCLHHPLYREDRLALSLRASSPSGRWALAVRPALRRCRVAGFPSEHGRACALSCTCLPCAAARIGLEWSITPVEGWGASFVTAALSLSGGGCRLTVNRLIGGSRDGDGRIGVEAEIGAGVTLLSGYHVGNDEIAAGVLYRAGRTLFGVSWSDHESLGTTLTFGMGRVWRI